MIASLILFAVQPGKPRTLVEVWAIVRHSNLPADGPIDVFFANGRIAWINASEAFATAMADLLDAGKIELTPCSPRTWELECGSIPDIPGFQPSLVSRRAA